MRKVLYSPGFGAGWTTWHHGTTEEKRFMLEHAGLIEAVERGEETGEGSTALRQFVQDFEAAFPDSRAGVPYLGGADSLVVHVAADGQRVRVEEYDGSESVVNEGDDEGWL